MMHGEGGVKDLRFAADSSGYPRPVGAKGYCELECGVGVDGGMRFRPLLAGSAARARRREQAGLWCVALALRGLLPLAP